MTERIVYLNGEFVPQSEAVVSVMDWGFSGGDGVYEATRTFGHELFRLEDHLDRLDRSLAYIRIDTGLTRDEMAAASRETVARNLEVIGPDDEFALWHVITRGDRLAGDAAKSTVVMYCLDVGFAGIRALRRSRVRKCPRSFTGSISPHVCTCTRTHTGSTKRVADFLAGRFFIASSLLWQSKTANADEIPRQYFALQIPTRSAHPSPNDARI